MKNSYFIPTFVLVWLMLSSDASGYKSKLILGFEVEELAAKKGETWCEIKGVGDGCDFWANFEFGVGDRIWTWQCRKGDSTEGVQALISSVQPGLAQARFLRTAFQQRYYPILRKSAAEASVILNTFQWLAYTQPDLRDWSDYDLLWIDLKTDKPLKVWLTLEDEIRSD